MNFRIDFLPLSIVDPDTVIHPPFADGGEKQSNQMLMLAADIFRYQNIHRLPDHQSGAVTQQMVCSPVGHTDDASGINQKHRIRTQLKQGVGR